MKIYTDKLNFILEKSITALELKHKRAKNKAEKQPIEEALTRERDKLSHLQKNHK